MSKFKKGQVLRHTYGYLCEVSCVREGDEAIDIVSGQQIYDVRVGSTTVMATERQLRSLNQMERGE